MQNILHFLSTTFRVWKLALLTHVCFMGNWLASHSSAHAWIILPYGPVGQRQRPLSIQPQLLTPEGGSYQADDRVTENLASFLHNFLDTLKFSILTLLFIYPPILCQGNFSISFYVISPWLYDICLEPAWLCFSTSHMLVLTSKIRF